jgi:hypothetical protein
VTAEVSAVPRPSIDADGNEVESVPVGTIRIATYEGLVAQAMHIRHFEGSIIITEVNQATQLAFAAARFSCSGRWRAASFVLRQQKCKPLGRVTIPFADGRVDEANALTGQLRRPGEFWTPQAEGC